MSELLQRATDAHRYGVHLIGEARIALPHRRLRIASMAAEQLVFAARALRDLEDLHRYEAAA